MTIDNPYEAPAADLSAPPEELVLGDREYGGIDRRTFLGGVLLVWAVGYGFAEVAASVELVAAVLVAQLAVLVALACQRLKNLGMSPWLGPTILVPIYNLLVGLRCLAYPRGWVDHRRLDTAGKVVVGLVLACFGLVVLAIVAMIGAG